MGIAPEGGKGYSGQTKKTTLKDEDKKAGGTSLAKTIGWLNAKGGLQDKICYSEVIEPLNSLGESKANQLLGELGEQAWTISNPTKWLLKAVENGGPRAGGGGGKSKGKGKGKGSWEQQALSALLGGNSWGMGGGWAPVEPSTWVSKAIRRANQSGTLKEEIQWKECIHELSAIPEGVAVDLVKQVEAKAAEVSKPTAWLCAAVRKYNTGKKWKAGNGVLSKRIGELNKQNVLQQPVMWHEVSGPLTLMSEEDALNVILELEASAAEVKNPTNWLFKKAGYRLRHGKGEGVAE